MFLMEKLNSVIKKKHLFRVPTALLISVSLQNITIAKSGKDEKLDVGVQAILFVSLNTPLLKLIFP